MQRDRDIDHRAQLVTCPHAQPGAAGAVRCARYGRVVHVGVCLRGCPPPASAALAIAAVAHEELSRQRMWECSQCDEYNGNICELRGGCRCSFGKFAADPASRCPQGAW